MSPNLARALWFILLVFCGLGLLFAWAPGSFLWHSFECLVFALTVIWLAGWASGKLPARIPLQTIPFAGIIAIGAIQLKFGWTIYYFATRDDLFRWAAFLAVFFLAFQLSDGEDTVRSFRTMFLAYATVVGVVSLLQWFAGNGKIFWIFTTQEKPGMGPFLNYDHYASFCALALPVALYQTLRNPSQRWLYSIITATLYASVIASGSRAGFLLVTAELILMFFLVGFSVRAFLAEIALIAAFGLVVGGGYLYDRMSVSDPYAGRREIASATVQMVKAEPEHGFGLGTWTDVYPAFAKKDFGVFVNAAHNDWLQWSADGGIPMLACMLLLFAASLAVVPRAPWALGVSVIFIHGLIDFPMQGRFLPSVVFLVLGVAARSTLRPQDEHALRSTRRPAAATKS